MRLECWWMRRRVEEVAEVERVRRDEIEGLWSGRKGRGRRGEL